MDAHIAQKRIGILWLLGSLLLVSAAQLLFKHAMLHLPLQTAGLDFQWSPDPEMFLVPLAIGIAAYGLSVLCWMSALGRLPLSFAYPLLSLSYLFVYLGALAIPELQEHFSVRQLCGIVLLLAGALLVVWPAPTDKVS